YNEQSQYFLKNYYYFYFQNSPPKNSKIPPFPNHIANLKPPHNSPNPLPPQSLLPASALLQSSPHPAQLNHQPHEQNLAKIRKGGSKLLKLVSWERLARMPNARRQENS